MAELRTEAEALRLGLQAVLDLQDYSTFQSDYTCSTIWTLLSAASVQNTVNVQWIPAHVGIEGNDLADSEAKRGSTLPQPAVSLDYIKASATLVTNQHAIAATRYDSDPHTRVHRAFTDIASSPLLATRLDQRSVRHGGSTAHGPFSIVGSLPAPHRTSRLSHLSTLQWC